ncbi:KaiC domain-containing protein [Halorubrum sp. CSM-61]|uniref:KaiC domain-containing protein n=1 Tax=Halorubrum sp. CSM-61 TaxID=2485838 RepID=UPI000F4C6E66|nr:KaiC domain-containing protein [Halorubrum sp. CSM-61]
MSEDDDWFERALRDADADSGAADDGDEDGAGDDRAEADAEAHEGDEPQEAAEHEGDDNRDAERDAERGRDPFGGIREGERDPSRGVGGDLDEGDFGDDDFGGEAPDDDPFGGGSFGEDDPFGGGSAGGDTEDPAGSEGGFGGGSFGEDDPFGGGEGDEGGGDDGDGGPPSGGRTGGGPAGGSADPFGGYRGSAAGDSGGPNDVGFGEFDGGEGGDPSSGFDADPDEFESSIERTDVGIEGLDEMILGGVPCRSLLSVIGGAGTGKTTFALQFLNEALESDRKGIYITLEQTRESILSTAEEKGWSFREHADEDRLAVVAIDPIEMANSLASIRNDLVRLIAEFDADRLVLDSVSLLEMMYDDPAKRRSEVFGFTRSLKAAGVTTLLTSEASERNPYASRHGIVEYLTDAVFVLQYIRGTDFRETRLAVEIQKIRDANHSRQSKPYEITDTGISVYGQANIF